MSLLLFLFVPLLIRESRYVKVVIEIPAQSKSAPEKEDLLRRTLETCIDYVKYPETTEIEVRIQEVQPEDCVSIRPGGR